MNSSPSLVSRRVTAFTLVELLVSTAIIALLMLVLVAMTNQTTQTWQYTAEKIEKFQEARDGFESMTRQLSQATLNTYWEYLGVVPSATGWKNDIKLPQPRSKQVTSTDYKDFVPLRYGRMSELRFIAGPMINANDDTLSLVQSADKSNGIDDNKRNWPTHGVFFQAPFGDVDDTSTAATTFADKVHYEAMNNLLNTWGYFVEVGFDLDRPKFIADNNVTPKRWVSRLMEFRQPSEKMALYDTAYPNPSTSAVTTWFSAPLTLARTNPARPVRMLAENVTALIILPKLSVQDAALRKTNKWSTLSVSPSYIYDSVTQNTLTDSNGNKVVVNPGVTSISTASGDASGINPKNQLPPIVQVTLVAIDKRSAKRWVDLKGNTDTIGPDPNTVGNKFLSSSDTLENPGTGDLALYEQKLIANKLTYRIFTTNVTIRGAKWSNAQTN